jgi:hypothetical protein
MKNSKDSDFPELAVDASILQIMPGFLHSSDDDRLPNYNTWFEVSAK